MPVPPRVTSVPGSRCSPPCGSGSPSRAGYTRVLLDVGHENLPAQRLYERHGFTRTGTSWENPLYGGIREIGYAVGVTPGCRSSVASGTVEA